MVKVFIVMVKVFVKVPYIACVGYACLMYYICPSVPADDGVIRGYIQADAATNIENLEGILLDGKGVATRMNMTIVTTSCSNTGIGFALPVDQFKPAVEKIINVSYIEEREGDNCGGWQ